MANADSNKKNIVVLQLTGGNDALNTVIPYNDGNYYDNRPYVNISQEDVLSLDDKHGLNPSLSPITSRLDRGKLAVICGVCYASPNSAHFRAMHVWHPAHTAVAAV